MNFPKLKAGLGLIMGLLIWSSGSLIAQSYQDYIGQGHNKGIRVSSSGISNGFSAEATLDGIGIDSAFMLIQSARFLEQATMGANRAMIEELAEMGFEAWIDREFQKDPSYTTWSLQTAQAHFQRICDEFRGTTEEKERVCDDLLSEWTFRFNMGWFHSIMTGEDYLRQRVALALSEILVISGRAFNDQQAAFVIADYYDMLLRHAFGNYEELLMETTLKPAMGSYLSHFNNPKTVPELNIRPDENYAREIMQLFTIGLFELNMDGSQKLDENGEPIPTYDNDDIKEFAKVFTGLGDGGQDGAFGTPPFVWSVDFYTPMRMYKEWHEPGEKKLLNGFVVPDGQDGMEDIKMAVNHLFNHPNTAPFIVHKLIQRLVKSNPTPAYIERVAKVFEDNGQGERGDLGAVVKAILLDSEARDCEWIDDFESGKLREPLLRYTHFLKAMEAKNEANQYFNTPWYFGDMIRQLPMYAPSVFNFFLPDYQPNGIVSDADLVAPEFQLHNTSTSISYINIVHAMTMWNFMFENGWEYDVANLERPESIQVGVDYSQWQFSNNDRVLLDELSVLLSAGKLSNNTKTIILGAMAPFRDWFEGKLKMAIYLIMISPEYNITR